MKGFSKIALFALVITIISACSKDDPCEDNLSCTEEFVTIVVSVQDGQGNPIVLDSWETVLNDKDQFSLDKGSFLPAEEYPLISDAERGLLSNEGDIITFVGFIEGETILEQQFKVRDDCCHVELLEGQKAIVID